MQAATQAAPQAPVAPVTPRPTSITTVGSDGATQTITIPKSEADVEALLRTRRELSDQLVNAQDRRQQLVNQIRSAPDGVARTGLEDRVRVLDQRLIQLESDLALTGRQIAGAPADVVSFIERREARIRNQNNGDWEEGMFVGSFFTILALSAYMLVRRWRGRKNPKRAKNELPSDSAQRLERLEQGMDSIAIEIERISEGQRFVTKLLAESRQPAELRE